jgi:cell fate regulator YaaT (PSP1 superfamily)
MSEFRPISIKMAKQQDLPLSPMEISGVCGRLLCCLAYENDHYGEVKRRMPRVGQVVDTPKGSGKVRSLNVLQETVTVDLPGEIQATFGLSDLGPTAETTERSGRKRSGRRKRG